MKHPVHMGRLFAQVDMESADPDPLDWQEFAFTELCVGQPVQRRVMRFPSAIEANSYELSMRALGRVVIFDHATGVSA